MAVPRWTLRLAETGWGDTAVPLPDGDWNDRLTGRMYSGVVAAGDLFAELPGALLERAL